MSKMLLAGIKRKHQFSPNHVGNDRAIFNCTVAQLKRMGYQVNEYEEDELISRGLVERNIFSMAREPQVLAKLQERERAGGVIVNSVQGVENCFRNNQTRILGNENAPVPESVIMETVKPDKSAFEALGPCWVKRGDFHALHREDVVFVPNAAAGCNILAEYARRGITAVTVSKHIPGDLVKFYGVRGTDFFFHFYPEEYSHSKFGHEAVNGKPNHYSLDTERLKATAFEVADILNVDIFGGDVIVTAKGEIFLIDMNDWPSFAPCREEAALPIAQRIHQLMTS
ncbi:MAG: hypothetical protein LBH91_08180 [Prevotellaceae bacterium]|nr:hypothetical protein [Prevotellaceae bacterium]